ncbi:MULTISPECIES: hypothetical protein [unclassified Flavobacterium]|uniref:hypothetical protein n=1 Tax=unclassified Flavobacterium TaxID=196869 RepID=UPI001F12A250|nr:MULTISPECIES: hypothetical protein [unclassified Flavobacterium]UMY65271.1 hypothetical protein MKO97_12275 [Flavobacterium sp. HJ-32-4]
MKQVLFMVLFVASIRVFSQEVEDTSIQDLYVTRFEGLTPIDFTTQFATWKEDRFCSLFECALIFDALHPKLQQKVAHRMAEIARIIVATNRPLFLLIGMNSVVTAQVKNENTEDEKRAVYISIAGCTPSLGEQRVATIVNKISADFMALSD